MGRGAAIVLLGVCSLRRASAAIGVGDAHVCATVGVTPKCWGYNRWGQLGRGDTNTTGDEPGEMGDDLIPVELGTAEVVSTFTLGEDHTCTLLESGDVKCFGKNDSGQLGLGDTESRGQTPSTLGNNLPAVDFGTGLTAVQISAGCTHNCALLDDGSVKCFGYNNYGQLGQGSTDSVGDDAGDMGDNLAAVPLDGDAIAVAAGCDFSCALMEGGTVYCWGRNTWGQLGTGDSSDRLDGSNSDLVAVDLNTSVVNAIAAGEGHVCALSNDATAKCWGHNNNGQLGQGDNEDRGATPESLGANLAPIAFGSGDVVSSIDLGAFHTCALLQDGMIKCFGQNQNGELGIGSDVDVGLLPTDMGANLTAVDLGEDATASEISVGGATTCAVLEADGGIKCWGRGSRGQLGQGDGESIGETPGAIAELEAIDVGTDVFGMTPAPTPGALPVTSMPTAAPTQSTRQITLPPVTTLAPDASSTPVTTEAPTTVDNDVTPEGSSASSVRLGAGSLAAMFVGAIGGMALL